GGGDGRPVDAQAGDDVLAGGVDRDEPESAPSGGDGEARVVRRRVVHVVRVDDVGGVERDRLVRGQRLAGGALRDTRRRFRERFHVRDDAGVPVGDGEVLAGGLRVRCGVGHGRSSTGVTDMYLVTADTVPPELDRAYWR